jgi:hypothetical protein
MALDRPKPVHSRWIYERARQVHGQVRKGKQEDLIGSIEDSDQKGLRRALEAGADPDPEPLNCGSTACY